MTFSRRWAFFACTSLAVLLGISACGRKDGEAPGPVVIPKPPSLETVWTEFDKFESQLMERARKTIGDGDDYRIFATTLDYPIGTLLRLDKVIPIAECKVPEPRSAQAPSMFPDYKLSKSLAVSLGVDPSVLARLAELGASIKDEDAFTYRISETTVRVLNDRDLKDVLASKACTDAMEGKAVRLIRGQITGQRDFIANVSVTGQLKGKVTQIGSFDVSGGVGNSTISIQDPQARAFLQVISLVTPPAENKAAAVATTASAAGIVATASAQAKVGQVFIQQDRSDDRDASPVVRRLQSQFSVSSTVEKLDTSKMPRDPEVRYFNDADRQRAEQIASDLKANGYATAQSVRLGLQAPPGQVEVWLPKNAPSLSPPSALRVK